MKKLMTVGSLLFFYSFIFSQELLVKSGSKGMYLEHKVAAKEGLFPIGRMYNVHPRHIANFNGIDFNKGLAIGQKINILQNRINNYYPKELRILKDQNT